MTVYSNVEPTAIFVDKIENGVATVLMRTNITSSSKTDPMGNSYTEWQYDESILTWALPEPSMTKEDVLVLLESPSFNSRITAIEQYLVEQLLG